MPTIIQTHLITEKTWQETTDKAKELEHIIRKCDPPAAALPTLAKGTAVPSLYSHIAHSDDKEETDIPQPFKGAQHKQPKHRGGGKGKQPPQKPKNLPVQTQDDSYSYDDTNNYYHTENYRGQPRECRPYRGQNTGCFFRGQNFHGRGQQNQNPYQGQYQNNGYQSHNYQGNRGFYHNPDLLNMLKATRIKTVAEASNDHIWGTGVPLRDTRALNKSNWHSNGWLSHMLHTIRDSL